MDFFEAQKLWRDVDALVLSGRIGDEPRFLLIAKMDGKLWSAIFTPREGNVRIISVRRARTSEEAQYEQTIPDDSKES